MLTKAQIFLYSFSVISKGEGEDEDGEKVLVSGGLYDLLLAHSIPPFVK